MPRLAMVMATLVVAATAATATRAQEVGERPPATAAEDPLFREVVVPLEDGRLQLADLGRALLENYGFDGAALPLPDHRVDLRGPKGRLLLFAVRKTLLDTARFDKSRDGDTLLVTIDRARTREVRRQLRSRLVDVLEELTGKELLARNYQLTLPSELDAARPLVVLVHGVESNPGAWSDLQAWLGRAPGGHQMATFAYPNDEAVERIAAELSARLRPLGAQPVAIVAHSMGGLIARAMVEDPALDPGNVKRLILVGTPNGGSRLGGLRFALDAAHLLDGGEEGFGRALLQGARDNLLDGLGEAGGDLMPGSVLLARLDQRDRNPEVDYRVILGTRAILTPSQLALVRQNVMALLDSHRSTRILRPKVAHWLEDLDEVVRGRGDGAVSTARGSLPGVEPVLVPLDHIGLIRLQGLLGRIDRAEDHPVFQQVALWLDEMR